MPTRQLIPQSHLRTPLQSQKAEVKPPEDTEAAPVTALLHHLPGAQDILVPNLPSLDSLPWASHGMCLLVPVPGAAGIKCPERPGAPVASSP